MLRLTLTLTCPEKQSQKCMNAYYWQTAGWFLSRGAHQGSSRLQNPSTLLWFSQENQSTAHFTQPAEGCTWKCRGFVYEVGRTLHMRSKPNEKHGSGSIQHILSWEIVAFFSLSMFQKGVCVDSQKGGYGTSGYLTWRAPQCCLHTEVTPLSTSPLWSPRQSAGCAGE